MKKALLLTCALFSAAAITQAGAEGMASMAPEGASLYMIEPMDGETVESTFTVKFGLSGMGVAPAGVEKEKTGHHHLIIDTELSSLDMTVPLPATDQVKHFGGGQTETTVTLPPGTHTLQLVLGNHLHVPFDPPLVSDVITVTVE